MIVSYKSDEQLLFGVIGILTISIVACLLSFIFYFRFFWGVKREVIPVRREDGFYDGATGIRLYPSAKDYVLAWPIYSFVLSREKSLGLRVSARNGVAMDVIVVGKVGVVEIGRPAIIPIIYVLVCLALCVWQYSGMK